MAFDYKVDHDEVVRLYESGLSQRQVSVAMGCSRTTVRHALAIKGVQCRQAGANRPKPDGEIQPELERELLEVRDKHTEAQAKLKQAYRDETLLKTLQAELAAAIHPFTTTPPNAAVKKHQESTLVHGVALLSDEHGDLILDPEQIWGLDHYSYDIFRCRLQAWANLVVNYVNVYLPEFVVPMNVSLNAITQLADPQLLEPMLG